MTCKCSYIIYYYLKLKTILYYSQETFLINKFPLTYQNFYNITISEVSCTWPLNAIGATNTGVRALDGAVSTPYPCDGTRTWDPALCDPTHSDTATKSIACHGYHKAFARSMAPQQHPTVTQHALGLAHGILPSAITSVARRSTILSQRRITPGNHRNKNIARRLARIQAYAR